MGGERERGSKREEKGEQGSRGGAEHTQKIIEETGDAFLLQRRGKELGGGGARDVYIYISLCMGMACPPFAAVGVKVCQRSLNRTSRGLPPYM